MAWIDDFTTDHFADATYTAPFGPPTSVGAHVLTETGTLLWYDTAQAQVPPLDVAIDVLGASDPADLLVVGALTPDFGTGAYGGWDAATGGLVAIGAGGGASSSTTGAATWPVGNFTVHMTLDAAGHLHVDVDGQVLDLTLDPAVVAALSTTPINPIAYMSDTGSLHCSEWRVGGGAPPPPPPPSRSTIEAGQHQSGIRLRNHRR